VKSKYLLLSSGSLRSISGIIYSLALCTMLAFVPTLTLFAQEEQELDQPDSNSAEFQVQGQLQRKSAGDSIANFKQLVANLSTILSTKYLANSKFGVAVYSLDKQKMLFERNINEPLTPASTTKLFYTYAALKILGPSYKIPTAIYTDGAVSSNGTLNGNLYIVGKGDCLLTTADIEQIADQVRNAGITTINGNIIGDGSFFDGVTDRQAYSGDAERMQDLPPVTALSVNKNLVTVVARSNGSGRPSVQTIPSSEGFQIVYSQSSVVEVDDTAPEPKSHGGKPNKKARAGQAKNVPLKKKAGKSTTKPLKKKRNRAEVTGSDNELLTPYPEYGNEGSYGDFIIRKPKGRGSKKRRRVVIPRISISSSINEQGIQQFLVRGSGRNLTQSVTYEIKNPSLAVAGILFRSLKANGITISGNVKTGVKPQSAKFLTAYERPLFDLVSVVNKKSDNYIAEHIMKMVGATCCGNTQCNVNAYKTVMSILDSSGIATTGCQLFDGSGLSRKNKTTANTQINLLRHIAGEPFNGVFYSTLAIAGVDGTLARRMRGTNAENSVHAKTGTHGNVSALSGYTRTQDGERLCFSMIWNGNSVGAYKQIENLIATQLSEFSYTQGTVPALILK
jgi:D-alanyl-D-alanine carboxypeptidase